MSGGLASRRRQSQAGEAQGLDSVPQSLLHHAGHPGDSMVSEERLLPGHDILPKAHAAWVRPDDAAFPRGGRATSSSLHKGRAAPVLSWGSGTFDQARRSQSQHSRHPGLENSLLWGLSCALLYVSLSPWPQPTNANCTIPPSLSKL